MASYPEAVIGHWRNDYLHAYGGKLYEGPSEAWAEANRAGTPLTPEEFGTLIARAKNENICQRLSRMAVAAVAATVSTAGAMRNNTLYGD